MASLSYTEWCDKNRFRYDDDPDRREAHNRFCEAEERAPHPTPSPGLDGTITHTWMQDREKELHRRSCQIHYRIIFPPPIPIVSLPSLADNERLSYHGLD